MHWQPLFTLLLGISSVAGLSTRATKLPDDQPGSMTAQGAANMDANDGSKRGIFFRGDSRSPEEVFEKGFSPQGTDMNLQHHLSFAGESGYVSITRSRAAAIHYAFGRTGSKTTTGYIYRIAPNDLPAGYWIPAMYKGAEVQRNQEFAVAGAVRAANIEGVYTVTKKKGKIKMGWNENPIFGYKASMCTIARKRAACIPLRGSTDMEEIQKAEIIGEEIKLSIDDPLFPKEETAAGAETIAKELFTTNMEELGFSNTGYVVAKKSDLTFADLRARFKGYSRVDLGAAKKAWAEKWAGKATLALSAVTLPFYIQDVVNVFGRDSTGLEKAATVASIVPLLGCELELKKDIEEGTVDNVDTSLCYFGDSLLFTPLAPLSFVVQLARMGYGLLKDDKPEDLQAKRRREWRARLKLVHQQMSSEEWRTRAKSRLRTEVAAIMYTYAEFHGMSLALYTEAREAAPDDAERDRLDHEFGVQHDAEKERLCAQIANKALNFPLLLRREAAEWADSLGKEYFAQFLDEVKKQFGDEKSWSESARKTVAALAAETAPDIDYGQINRMLRDSAGDLEMKSASFCEFLQPKNGKGVPEIRERCRVVQDCTTAEYVCDHQGRCREGFDPSRRAA